MESNPLFINFRTRNESLAYGEEFTVLLGCRLGAFLDSPFDFLFLLCAYDVYRSVGRLLNMFCESVLDVLIPLSDDLVCMRSKSVSDVLNAQGYSDWVPQPINPEKLMPFQPTIDGTLIVDEPIQLIQASDITKSLLWVLTIELARKDYVQRLNNDWHRCARVVACCLCVRVCLCGLCLCVFMYVCVLCVDNTRAVQNETLSFVAAVFNHLSPVEYEALVAAFFGLDAIQLLPLYPANDTDSRYSLRHVCTVLSIDMSRCVL